MTRDSGKEGVRLAVEHLARREHILMFPEGTRTRDGSVGPLHPGVKLIAQKAGVPIIPTAIHGLYEMWPRTRKTAGDNRHGEHRLRQADMARRDEGNER